MQTTSPPAYREPPSSRQNPPQGSGARPVFVSRVVAWMSWLNFAAVIATLFVICIISEDWWLSLALTYLPRVPYLIPSVLLAAAALLVRRRMVWLNLLSILIVLGPIMGFRLPLASMLDHGTGEPLTVLTYNVQRGGDSFDKILAEVANADADLIVFQEATSGIGPLKDYLEDWHIVHSGEYFVAAKWPVQLKSACRTEAFRRATAILCEVDHPETPFQVIDIHHTTARYGLAQLRVDSPLSGHGVDKLETHQDLRDLETFETRGFAADVGLDTPLLVMGDFNMPTSSSLFQKYWAGMTSAFDSAGFGYGYTSPCNTDTHWPDNTPWLRIDHILLSKHWSVESCWIGESNGSDHRYIAAKVRLR